MILGGKTPYEILFGSPPFISHLRVFGCLCYAKNINREKDKFASRSHKCIFMGYPYGKKGWKVYDLDRKVCFESRDVEFVEHVFPFAHTDFARSAHPDPLPTVIEPTILEDVPEIEAPPPVSEYDGQSVEEGVTADGTVPIPEVAEVTGTAEDLGRGKRARQPSVRLHDYVLHTATIRSSSSPSSSLAFSGTPYPIANYVNCAKFSLSHRRFAAAVTTGIEPTNFKEAMQHSCWREAMRKEVEALGNNGTWTVSTLPMGKKALGSKWVYKIKYHADGTIERYKARLVVFGNHQIEGLDYTETFAPTAKMVTVRTFLAVAAIRGWELHQMDVHNAFLHGDLEEEVYMRFPPGFTAPGADKVCRLRKSLSGLRQALRCWFAKLAAALVQYGFQQSGSDYSLFTFRRDKVQLTILVYVDDLVIGGNDSDAIHAFKTYLNDCFRMKDLGKLKYFLGLEVARNSTGIFLCQRKYALDIISETGLLGAKPAGTPMEQNHHLALAKDEILPDFMPYRRLIGRLIYLTITRPELSYCVHILAQFLQEPRHSHWEAALRVVRFLKLHPGQGLLLRSNSSLHLTAYCDADWASCTLTRRSLTAYFVFLGDSPISWQTKKQHTVSRSSAEAEYRSLASTTCELKWLKGLLASLGVPHSSPMRIYCDSQSALHLAHNPVFHERTKHIEVDCHFVRDEIRRGIILPQFVSSSHQLADILTKALGKRSFDDILCKLGISDLHTPT